MWAITCGYRLCSPKQPAASTPSENGVRRRRREGEIRAMAGLLTLAEMGKCEQTASIRSDGETDETDDDGRSVGSDGDASGAGSGAKPRGCRGGDSDTASCDARCHVDAPAYATRPTQRSLSAILAADASPRRRSCSRTPEAQAGVDVERHDPARRATRLNPMERTRRLIPFAVETSSGQGCAPLGSGDRRDRYIVRDPDAGRPKTIQRGDLRTSTTFTAANRRSTNGHLAPRDLAPFRHLVGHEGQVGIGGLDAAGRQHARGPGRGGGSGG